ncbi:hypothetical protein BN9982_250030 [Mycobacterium tuberculosis]|nr:hypothetical protein BN9982_250030 [Mycobacterium tuberculosis]
MATALSAEPAIRPGDRVCVLGFNSVALPQLIRMVARTPRGRVATALAWTHLGMTPPVGASQPGLFE